MITSTICFVAVVYQRFSIDFFYTSSNKIYINYFLYLISELHLASYVDHLFLSIIVPHLATISINIHML
ncbi:unnamed protein product [Rotaria socialis]